MRFATKNAVAMLILAAAGASPANEKTREIESNWLSFLRPGSTTRADALLQLGRPHMSFENERLLLFRLAPPHRKHGMLPIQWSGYVGTEYHVTLRFDANGTLRDLRAVER